MSVNSSNSSLLPQPLPSSASLFYQLCKCFNSTAGTYSITLFTIINILFLLPLYIFVIFLGHQRWRRRRSSTAMSHSDFFTYHMVVMEMMSILGYILTCCAVFTDLQEMMMSGIFLFSITLSGEMYFHLLTCAERYLAVIHPVTYMGLRKASGLRIRNVTAVCVWLLCFAGASFMYMEYSIYITIPSFFVITFALITISFCSLSVLCVLIRPGPGEGGGSRQQARQSKLRAFYTIMAILGVLLLRFGGNIFTSALYIVKDLGETGRCALWLSIVWFCLPSSLVLPLLFLHRAGKLPCCKNNTDSGQESN